MPPRLMDLDHMLEEASNQGAIVLSALRGSTAAVMAAALESRGVPYGGSSAAQVVLMLDKVRHRPGGSLNGCLDKETNLAAEWFWVELNTKKGDGARAWWPGWGSQGEIVHCARLSARCRVRAGFLCWHACLRSAW
jgi:hypothetical protein